MYLFFQIKFVYRALNPGWRDHDLIFWIKNKQITKSFITKVVIKMNFKDLTKSFVTIIEK